MKSGKLSVLVTGGAGRIGNYVVSALLDRGHNVINFDRRRQNDDRARFVFGDVRDRKQVQAIMSECQAVCHLAEIPSAKNTIAEDEIFWSNAQAASVILQSAADLRLKRVIYTSSCQVYGYWGEPFVSPLCLPMDETHPAQPQNVYAQSKVANEGFAQLMSRTHNLPISIFRFPAVKPLLPITPGWLPWLESDSGPLPELGVYIHPSDAASAYALAVESDRPGCEAYNILAPDVMSLFPLRARLLKHHPELPPLPESWPDFKSPVLTDKAREHFGWEAKWSIHEELQKLRKQQATK